MASIFSKIIHKQIPSYLIAEDEYSFAFLDIHPLAEGHTLVIPKREEDYLFDLTDEELSRLTLFAKRVAKAIQSSMKCKRVGITVIGFEVPHAHIHLVPINNTSDINFSNSKLLLSKEEFMAIAEKIKADFR